MISDSFLSSNWFWFFIFIFMVFVARDYFKDLSDD